MLWCSDFKQNIEEFYNSQTPPSEGPGSMSTNTLSRILPTPHFKLLSKQRIWVTPYQEVQTSSSTLNQMMHLKDEDGEKSCREDLDPYRRRSRSLTQVTFPHQEGRPWCFKHQVHNQWILFSENTLRHRIWRQHNGRSHLSAPAWNHAPTTNIYSAPDDF